MAKPTRLEDQVKIRGIRRRWLMNSVAIVLLILTLAVGAFAAMLWSYYYDGTADDLERKAKTGVVSTGSMSDPYNPFEEELLLTRHALELLSAYGFGAAIATKSELILRDIDVLQEIAQQKPAVCKITITTCDDALAAKVEP